MCYVLIGGNDEVSSHLDKRELSAAMCKEGVLMWTLHRAVILQGNQFILLLLEFFIYKITPKIAQLLILYIHTCTLNCCIELPTNTTHCSCLDVINCHYKRQMMNMMYMLC